MEKQQYWPLSNSVGKFGLLMEFRSAMAWQLIERFGLISGRRGTEDSQGRAAIEEMPPAEIVQRAFAIADEFVEAAQSRGELKEFTEADLHDAYSRIGQLEDVKMESRFARVKSA